MKRAKTTPQRPVENVCIQEFLDMIAPAIVKFNTDLSAEAGYVGYQRKTIKNNSRK